ncbi:MAG TPA: acetyl-CoA carboxylase biotin carboxyl carrier protein subunit [Chloroflexi bacterium]|nr:acetyl-CoA carboxylase biotin carboxyl carrier protein subunit [Chloroflexota bacterium]
MKYITTIGDREFTIEIINRNLILVDGVPFEVDFTSISGQPVYSLLVDGKSYEGYMYANDDEWEVLLQGILYNVQVEDERERRLRQALGDGPALTGEFHLKAPMPGLVVAVPVEDGQEVAKGEVLVILESMKMQNELKSPRDGKVSRIRVKVGDSVERKQTLLSVV